jgi:hypothetical protein
LFRTSSKKRVVKAAAVVSLLSSAIVFSLRNSRQTSQRPLLSEHLHSGCHSSLLFLGRTRNLVRSTKIYRVYQVLSTQCLVMDKRHQEVFYQSTFLHLHTNPLPEFQVFGVHNWSYLKKWEQPWKMAQVADNLHICMQRCHEVVLNAVLEHVE